MDDVWVVYSGTHVAIGPAIFVVLNLEQLNSKFKGLKYQLPIA
jgi:hypothetical protein